MQKKNINIFVVKKICVTLSKFFLIMAVKVLEKISSIKDKLKQKMTSNKYYYDSESMSFERIKFKRGRFFKRFFYFLLSSFLFASVILLLLHNMNYMYTPRELVLEREIKEYETQYSIMNKKMQQMEVVLKDIAQRDNDLYRTYFELNPIGEEQRKSGFGGVNKYEYLQNYSNSKLLIDMSVKIESLQKQLAVQSKSLDEIAKIAKDKEKLLSSMPAIQPVQNKDLKRMASGYGWRRDPFTKLRKFHYGMDFTAPTGTPVYASGDGVVTRADSNSSGYGNHIRIDHGFGYESLYAHLSKYNVRPGSRVKRGDVIGFVGNTGRSEAPHLHYEVKKNGQHLNPINFYYGSLTPEEYAKLSEESEQQNQAYD